MNITPVAKPSGAGREALALGLAVFALYAWQSCRTIYVGDSGELVAAVHTLGIPHPSGYPLYVLLGKLWTLLVPFGSVAWRMSLFSAAAGGAAVGLVQLALRENGAGRAAAALGAALLAFTPSFWAEATVQRVYTLNALFVAAIFLFMARWARGNSGRLGGSGSSDRWLVAAAFAAGLGATNHTFAAVAGVATGVAAVFHEPALLRRVRTLVAAVGAGLAGLLPYAYLPLRSRMDPRLDWGNPETLEGFLDVVLRRDFWIRRWIESPRDLGPILGDWASSFAVETWGVALTLGLAGAVVAWRRGGAARFLALAAVLVALANVLVMASHGSRADLFVWHRYYIPSYLGLALLAGFGATTLLARFPSRAGRAVAALALTTVLVLTGWREHDRSRYRIAEDYSRTVLATLPPGAHLLANDDNILFVLIYLQLVEGLRPDVNLVLQGVGQARLPQLRFDPASDPVYFTHHPNWRDARLEIAPVGLVFRTVPAGQPWPEPVFPKTALDGENDPGVPKDFLTENLISNFHYMAGVSFETRDWLRAKAAFDAAAASAPHNDTLFYNLGLIFARNGLHDRALAAFEHSHEINPRHLATQGRARAADRIAETRREIERLALIERRMTAGLDGAGLDDAARAEELARRLAAAGEPVAARGHRLRAAESEHALASLSANAR